MYLEELLNKNILEDDKIECKQSLNRIDVLDWLKTIAGFSNADGGTMYVGPNNSGKRRSLKEIRDYSIGDMTDLKIISISINLHSVANNPFVY